jgi:hypothetical protein
MNALKILRWCRCDDGSLVIEVKCQTPAIADDLPSTIRDTEGQEYQKWGFDPARRAAVYYAVPQEPTESGHAE